MIQALASVEPRSPCMFTALNPTLLVAAGVLGRPVSAAGPGLKKTWILMKLALADRRGVKMETRRGMRPELVRSGISVSNVCDANRSAVPATSSARTGAHDAGVATS